MSIMKISARKSSGIIPLEGISEVLLIPWTEYIGRIVHVTDDSLVLEYRQCISIPITIEASRELKTIQKGVDVGILAIDDGSIRVRRAA